MTRPRYAGGSEHRFTVRRERSVQSLSRYAAARLSLPLSWIERLLADGRIRLDGEVCLCGSSPERLKRGSEIAVRFPPVWPPHMVPTPMPLDILYEDEHLLALNKPPGVVVHPARGHMDGNSLQNGVLHHVASRGGPVDAGGIGPSHRLDKDTSGVIVYALHTESHRCLTRQFAERHPHKEYLALVDGSPSFDQTEAHAAMAPCPDDPSRVRVTPEHEGGKSARTGLYVLERGSDWALLRATPQTGRPHQVRVHCAHHGAPVIADATYNPAPARRPMARQALHAARLLLTHPVTDTPLRLAAPLPRDMEELLTFLRTR